MGQPRLVCSQTPPTTRVYDAGAPEEKEPMPIKRKAITSTAEIDQALTFKEAITELLAYVGEANHQRVAELLVILGVRRTTGRRRASR